MNRLQARTADINDEGFEAGFVAPTLIKDWVKYLNKIRPASDPEKRIADRHKRNIGYRLQLIEFECALIILHIETMRHRKSSTLHSTVFAFKNHQFMILANSILEGIGAHLFRVSSMAAGKNIAPGNKIQTLEWRGALINQINPPDGRNDEVRKYLDNQLSTLSNWRNLIHMDRIDADGPLDFDKLYGPDKFVIAYNTFRDVMTKLNPDWPKTCLNEKLD